MPRPHLSSGSLVACLLAGAAALHAGTAVQPPGPKALLSQVAGFSEADWSAVESGGAISKILDTDPREIAVAGAVRIAATRDRLVARVRDIENLKRSAVVVDVGRFGRPPSAADLATAPLEDYSLDLRACHPGDCRVRLGEAEIARFHRDVDWNAADWRTRAASIWREMLGHYATAYDREGRKALPVFVNRQEPLTVSTELALLVSKTSFVSSYSPAFYSYLKEHGPAHPPGTESTLYWSKEDFGVRPVLRISHQVIQPASDTAHPVIVATAQVYADHYLDAALGVTLALDASDSRGRGFYMIAVNRARTRSLSSFLRRMVRGTVQARSREAMRRILVATKAGLEGSP